MPRIINLFLLVPDEVPNSLVIGELGDALRTMGADAVGVGEDPPVIDWAFGGPGHPLPDTVEVREMIAKEGGFACFLMDYTPLVG